MSVVNKATIYLRRAFALFMKPAFAGQSLTHLEVPRTAQSPWFWIAVVMLTLLTYDNWTVFNTPALGDVDGSWSIGLNLVRLLGLRFGTEVVFTYGPLGFLCSTRLPIAIEKWQMLLYDTWLLLQSGVVIWAALRSFTVWRVLAVLLTVLYVHDTGVGEPPFLFYYFTLFTLFLHLHTGKSLLLAYALLIALFAFYVKANVGVVTIGSFLAYVVYWFITRRKRVVGLLATGVATVVLLVVSAWLLQTDLVSYVRNSLQIVDAYNDAMAMMAGSAGRPLLAALTVTGLLGGVVLSFLWLHRREGFSRRMLDTGLILAFSGLQFFVLYKQSFVRADPGHFALFFKYAVLPLSLIFLFTDFRWLKRAILIPYLVVMLAGVVLGPKFWQQRYRVLQPLQWQYYLTDVFTSRTYPISPDSTFPAAWRQRLARSTVDVLPVDISLIYSEGLARNYRPRPVFQTYQAASRYLDSLNAAHYRSAGGPAYLIAAHGSTDTRYAMGDEAMTKLAMMQQYSVLEQQPNRVLLQRLPRPVAVRASSGPVHNVRLNEAVPVPPGNGPLLMRADVDYSLAGRLMRLLFQPPPLTLEIETVAGKRFEYKTAVPLLDSGVWVNRHVATATDYAQYLMTRGEAGEPIRHVRIRNDRWRQVGFRPDVRIQFTRIQFN